jgi:dCTP deaminase
MILSDRDLKRHLDAGSILIEPALDLQRQLQPASIDLRLGREFRVFDACDEVLIRVEEGGAFEFRPGAFVLATTIERIRVPPNLVARVEGRSSIGRLGVIVHATAGFIDPGFEGEITLELANLSPRRRVLIPGMRICQIVFHCLSSVVERPYGPERSSKYSGQRGPTVSRLSCEFAADDELRAMRSELTNK